MIIHTAVHNRLDVLELWYAANKKFAPEAELHVWYSADKPTHGDVFHQMPHVGIGAAAYVVQKLPVSDLRVFIESDMIAVRPWTVDDYPGDLRMLEGSPGNRWHGITIARPGISLATRPELISQRYAHLGGCPDWLPADLWEPALAAQAKVVGQHWLHLDKMHRIQGTLPAKATLMAALKSQLFPS